MTGSVVVDPVADVFFLAALVCLLVALVLVALVLVLVACGDWWQSRGGWVLDERGAARLPAPAAPRSSSAPEGSQVSSLCEGCGQLHPPEALPLEMLLAGGVPVSVSRWFGGRRQA